MAILNFEHLFEQADRLSAAPLAGPPRQVDLRRAVSAAYYGLFHFVTTSVADQFVGVTQRASAPYTLFYRSIDHRELRDLCLEVKKQSPSRRFAAFVPERGWSAYILLFAAALIDLQEKRHTADYDPRLRINVFDAKLAIRTARSAVRRFQAAPRDERLIFISLLVCAPR